MTVSKTDFEVLIESTRRQTPDARAGLYGPASLYWTIAREGVVLAGGGSAALLQLAHPYVAHAVDQHSATRADMAGRFQRTFTNVFAIVFGDLDHAIGAARRVHAVHSRIEGEITEDVGQFARGHRYAANTEEALLWVHATLVHEALQAYSRLVRPLGASERAEYWQESKRFAHLFGITDRVMPNSYSDFERYFRAMIASDTIAVGTAARELATFLFTPPRRLLAPLTAINRVVTAGFLPEKVRVGYRLPFGGRERVQFRAAMSTIRAARRALPRQLRYFPAYNEALLRLEGRADKDILGRALERLAIAQMKTRTRD